MMAAMPAATTSDRWVAIDFETATAERTSACALGLAVIEGLDVVETASWLVQPPFNEYNWFNTRLHGIGPEHTAGAPSFEEAWPEIVEFLGGANLLAHNAAFDAGVLRSLLDRRELSAPPLAYACTVAMSRCAMRELPRHTLDVVCAHCSIELQHHDAASDALACALVAIECAHRVDAPNVTAALGALGVGTKPLLS